MISQEAWSQTRYLERLGTNNKLSHSWTSRERSQPSELGRDGDWFWSALRHRYLRAPPVFPDTLVGSVTGGGEAVAIFKV